MIWECKAVNGVNIFKFIEDSSFENGFIKYAGLFKSFLHDECGVEYSDMLKMILNDKVKNHSVVKFMMSNSVRHNRTLFYSLLHENYLAPAMSGIKNGSGRLYDLFPDSEEYFHKEFEDIYDTLANNGISSIFNSFSTIDVQLDKKLTAFAYNDLRNREALWREDESWAYMLHDYLTASARHFLFDDGCESIKDINFYNEEIIPEVEKLTRLDFFRIEKGAQSIILGEALKAVSEIDLDYDGDPGTVDLVKLAIEWPAEFGRARLIRGESVAEVVSMVSQLADTLLELSHMSTECRATVIATTIKRMLFNFPAEFAEFFPERPPVKDCIAKISSSSFLSEQAASALTRAQKLNPGWDSSQFGFSHKIIRFIRENGYNTNEAAFEINIGIDTYPNAIHDLFKQAEEIGKSLVAELTAGWMCKFDNDDKSLSLHAMTEFYPLVMSVDNDNLYEEFNRLFIKSMSVDCASPVVDMARGRISLIFKYPDSRERLIEKIVNENVLLTTTMIKLCKFKQRDFAPYWAKLSSESKRTFISNDLAL